MEGSSLEEQWKQLIDKNNVGRQEKFRQQALDELGDSINWEDRIQERIQELEKEHEESAEERWQDFIQEINITKQEKFRLQALRENEELLDGKAIELHKVVKPDATPSDPVDDVLRKIRAMQFDLIQIEKAVEKLKVENN